MRRAARALLTTALTGTLVAAASIPAGAADRPGDAPRSTYAAGNGQRSPYLVGRGIADITGEPAGNGMMGYARPEQRTSGIHQRQHSRAFVVADRASGERVVMVTADAGMIFAGVRDAVLRELAERHGGAYNEQNVMLTGTHTHSGPGGYSHETLYNVTTLGFHDKTFDALVDGIVESIERADADLAPSSLSVARGQTRGASVNRSRDAFERNPAEDKRHFPDGVDPTTTLLRVHRDGRPVGAIDWFPTHGTSMPPENTLISDDNKGYAAYEWEHAAAGGHRPPGDPGFVAAFAQTNAADMSPNLALRPGTGPTNDGFANTRAIGERQSDSARDLMGRPGEALAGGVDSRMSYVDMTGVDVRPEFTGDGAEHSTCDAALGASFAAGSTEDGPGPPIFHEGTGNNPLVGAASKALYQASPRLRQCHQPKDILLPVGPMGWTPKVLPLQILRVGSLHIVAVPQEVTAVGGLRLRRTVAQRLGVPTENVLVQGYANDYAGYTTTPEEYDQQDYEGGHTMYGRWQLPAYQQEFARIAADMRAGRPTAAGPPPPDTSQQPFRGQPAPPPDAPPPGHDFGDVLRQPRDHYAPGQPVEITFAGGDPNNDLHRGGTYVEVQRRDRDGWHTVADDGDWSTQVRWNRGGIAGTRADVTWRVPVRASAGTYRVVHHGDARDVLGRVRSFDGTSPEFTVG